MRPFRNSRNSILALGIHLAVFLFALPVLAERLPVPAEIRSQANKYISDVVGQKYFRSNYRFVKAESFGQRITVKSGAVVTDYYLYYDYLPLLKLVTDPQTVRFSRVSVRISTAPERSRLEAHVATIVDGEVVEPKISQSEAIRLVQSKLGNKADLSNATALPVSPSFMNRATNWFWKVGIPGRRLDQSCLSSSYYSVDMTSGAITGGWGSHVCE